MDFRVEDEIFESPKTVHLFELVGPDGFCWLMRLWAYTTKQRPDGVLSGISPERLEAILRVPFDEEPVNYRDKPRVAALMESGWLKEVGGVLVVSNWKERQPWVVGSKERSEIARNAGLASAHKRLSTPSQPKVNSESTPSQRMPNGQPNGNPTPSPSPSPTPNSNILSGKPEIEYEKIIEDLNKKTGQGYKHTSKVTREKIRARVNEGFTVEDFLTVNSKKAAEWMGTEMQKFLRPETLYGTKFEGYLNQKTTVGKTKDEIEFEQSLAESQRRVENTRKEMEQVYGTKKAV